MNWQKIFNLPENSKLSINITKKALMQQADITLNDIRLLDGARVQKIDIFGKLSQKNGNLRAYEEEKVSFLEILFIKIIVQNENFYELKNKVAQLIHKLIPHHCVIVTQAEDLSKSSLSLALKRISKNSPDLRVIEKEYFTKTILIEDKQFIESLNFENSETHNQKSYYEYLIKCVNAYDLAELTKEFKIRTYEVGEELIALKEQIKVAEEEIEYHRKKLNKDSLMAEKVAVNTKIHQLKQEINKINEKIENYE